MLCVHWESSIFCVTSVGLDQSVDMAQKIYFILRRAAYEIEMATIFFTLKIWTVMPDQTLWTHNMRLLLMILIFIHFHL